MYQLGNKSFCHVRTHTCIAPALQPDDYLFETQILQFSSNTTSFDISVRIVDDNVVEFDEMFLGVLTMTPADPAVILDPDQATVTIIDASSESEVLVFMLRSMIAKCLTVLAN